MYKLDPTTIFTAKFDANDYNNGACNGQWKDAKFMQPPYITMDNNSIKAEIGDAANRNACIYQHTEDTCQFYIGTNGVQQLDFDYEVTGDKKSNWFSFWINSRHSSGQEWVKDCEIDSIENMWGNFAGLGH